MAAVLVLLMLVATVSVQPGRNGSCVQGRVAWARAEGW